MSRCMTSVCKGQGLLVNVAASGVEEDIVYVKLPSLSKVSVQQQLPKVVLSDVMLMQHECM